MRGVKSLKKGPSDLKLEKVLQFMNFFFVRNDDSLIAGIDLSKASLVHRSGLPEWLAVKMVYQSLKVLKSHWDDSVGSADSVVLREVIYRIRNLQHDLRTMTFEEFLARVKREASQYPDAVSLDGL